MRINRYCAFCGTAYTVDLPDASGTYTVRCPQCAALNSVSVVAPAPVSPVRTVTAVQVVKRVRALELFSCVCWIILGAVQIYFIYTAAAGVWNIVNAVIGLINLRNIKVGNALVVPFYDRQKTMIIIFAVINIVIGGVVGVLLILIDWYTRDYVLRNRWAFEV